ncbi:hypothetical protein QVD17_30488 [Tagetes erecta]|uniref:RNA-directed DNA polymerase, eukaryota, reverse transcriptase zinc-binding domain protein n=1 Tax=Tagetes erecta TaxID=13708 RepID=A0AAD8NN05_TARER|nr:hypothetical protein QVD17_30488 [Tagetes erecta]
MAADVIHKVTSGIASKVTKIDGNPSCGILKKSAAQGASAAMADMSSKLLEDSYAEKIKATTGLESDKVKVGKNRVNFQFMQSKDEYPEADVKQADMKPFDIELRAKEADIVKRFKEASLDEELFLKQKSKVEWLKAGDNNTRFFHNSLKARKHRSRIDIIMDGGGNVHEGDNVQKAFVTHYENFLGCEGDTSIEPTPDLFIVRLDDTIANRMETMLR